ncbi:tRNA (guanosine(37)-N1)-methyltransferase TrmD [Candidatus Berkiella aquae]|uniref:tRNA (guanine-N(1)-)-methyltransferase n=2 Tax=Candidatus Berkiella aquae TaxID=295108 RepID=A0A0Q9YNI3_9GAMM|nr:tRNA (guanosine(37)-N1)-methyltransferase TrmD [Candidatus Berkiella aquae]MCS5712432.1 tRNA (guanosine(37)-N1)-methyltransferase TrmD [Candidatus Berkiella aquae]
MWCSVITIFPEMFAAIKDYGITGRAIDKGILALKTFDLRDFANDKHATVDDRPYGGGPGMVMMAEPLRLSLEAAKEAAPSKAKVIYVTPAGKRFDHKAARRLADEKQPLILVAGRYEGIDQRVIERDIDEQFSIGDYVLSGGELAVMTIIDALTRWLPGALGHEASAPNDAFSEENAGLLDCPHYTRPADLDGEVVPPVLLSGDHQAIALWRKKQALGQTWLKRPDLLQHLALDKTSQQLLAEFKQEQEN